MANKCLNIGGCSGPKCLCITQGDVDRWDGKSFVQKQTDWLQTDNTQVDFIKNKPNPVPQIQSDWNQTDDTSLDFIKNKPSSISQIQSDWTQSNNTSADYIKNKPPIPIQFNPIAGTNITLTGTYPNITFNSSGGGGGTETLQQACDLGYTTTTSIIIGSSNTAHSNSIGQLVQGANSVASGAGAVALNNSTSSGINSFSVNSSTASGQNSASFGTGNISSGNSSLSWGNTIPNTASGSASIAGGVGNSATGFISGAFGNNNLIAGQSAFGFGRDNGRGVSAVSAESSIMLGIQNGSSSTAEGSICLGGLNLTTQDFSVCAGVSNTTSGYAAVALGIGGTAKAFGEVVMASGSPSSSGFATQSPGTCQTSVVTYTQLANTSGAGNGLSIGGCTDAAGNQQSCGAIFGNTYYEIADNTIHYVQGRFIGVDSVSKMCVWTIDTYIKNVGGVVTFGTSNFTNVLLDSTFSTMTSVEFNSSPATGNAKKLGVIYVISSRPIPVKFSCTLFINKLSYS